MIHGSEEESGGKTPLYSSMTDRKAEDQACLTLRYIAATAWQNGTEILKQARLPF